jgi:D-alanyl-lipoteichoic acid acyltransferase DltB (MBOAT superfamily)
MFYPQLVAGPIERPQNLLPQFHQEHRFDWARIVSGLQLMLWGFFKKLVIADNLADFVNRAYSQPEIYPASALVVATVFFAIQIYCDFSGYSDIAIGSARVMGIKLMDNFRQPYFARSVADFWRRWHISLSPWFKDYVYVPLGGNRVSKARNSFNLLVTFVLSGVWHGANWTYLFWGLLNGCYLAVANNLTQRPQQWIGGKISRLPRRLVDLVRILATFGLTMYFLDTAIV